MKNRTYLRIRIILLTLLLFSSIEQGFAQQKCKPYSVDLSYSLGQTFKYENLFNGTDGREHYIVLGINKQTFGEKAWHRAYNYPNYGLTFTYQKNKQEFVGDLYAVMVHYTHFLFNRRLSIKLADGLAFATNPYDHKTNQKNIFITSFVTNAFRASIQWREENLWKGLGFELGASFSHYSNGKTKLRNKGLNTYFAHVGLNYSFGQEKAFIYEGEEEPLDKKIHYNFVARGGINENFTRTGYDKLYTFTLYADKRLNQKSGIQLGGDYFISDFLKNDLTRRKIDFSNADRIGVFVGHELYLNKFSIPIQIGCYVKKPNGYDKWLYQRVAGKYQIHKNFFMEIALKTHLGVAEAIEYSLGLRI